MPKTASQSASLGARLTRFMYFTFFCFSCPSSTSICPWPLSAWRVVFGLTLSSIFAAPPWLLPRGVGIEFMRRSLVVPFGPKYHQEQHTLSKTRLVLS